MSSEAIPPSAGYSIYFDPVCCHCRPLPWFCLLYCIDTFILSLKPFLVNHRTIPIPKELSLLPPLLPDLFPDSSNFSPFPDFKKHIRSGCPASAVSPKPPFFHLTGFYKRCAPMRNFLSPRAGSALSIFPKMKKLSIYAFFWKNRRYFVELSMVFALSLLILVQLDRNFTKNLAIFTLLKIPKIWYVMRGVAQPFPLRNPPAGRSCRKVPGPFSPMGIPVCGEAPGSHAGCAVHSFSHLTVEFSAVIYRSNKQCPHH